MATVQHLRGVLIKNGSASTGGWVAPAEIGFLPEEVRPVLPGWIGTDRSGEPVVCSRGFEALATGALQELATELRDIRDQARRLESRLDHLMGTLADGNPSRDSPTS
jgi:hypothetical protein